MAQRDLTMRSPVRYDVSLLTNDDLYLFNEGSHYRLYEKLGAHPLAVDGREGTYLQCGPPMRARCT
jgi:1,4-alpha-glucan branching enzyme